MKCQLYINLDIIFVTIFVNKSLYSLAYKQIKRSRYGSSLTENKIISKNAKIFFEWDLEYHGSFWIVRIDKTGKYRINSLEQLGVHENNNGEEISECFNQALYEKLVGYHASMIANDNLDAIMICGKSGCGKTTLAKRFIEKGYIYLSDDLALIDQQLCCYSFRTSFHNRVDKSQSSHMVNGEYRAFETVEFDNNISHNIYLKAIIILGAISKDRINIAEVNDIYTKFKLINSNIIGFPNYNYVFNLSQQLLTLPCYKINLSTKYDCEAVVESIGEII